MREGQRQADSSEPYKNISAPIPAEVYRKYYSMVILAGSDLKKYTAAVIADHVARNWKNVKDKA